MTLLVISVSVLILLLLCLLSISNYRNRVKSDIVSLAAFHRKEKEQGRKYKSDIAQTLRNLGIQHELWNNINRTLECPCSWWLDYLGL